MSVSVKRVWLVVMLWVAVLVFVVSAGLSAQAPAPLTLEQVNRAKIDLATQERLGALLNQAAGCEGRMLDLPTLRARVAQLEALEKQADPAKKPSQDAPVKP